uniref:Uncharacterized protein n=1 Tax=Clastoptera arizonana TaxID=38151 RepID=A0A1B6BZL8_9HEMI
MKRRSEEIYSNITDKDISDIKKKPLVNLRKSLDSSDISKISKISDKILLFNTIHEVFVCENENPSTILISCSNAEIMRKQNTVSEIKYMNLEDDIFVDLLKDMKEDEWEYAFSSLTAWLVPTSLMPTIMLRCLFYLILTTNDDFFLKRAVVAITSCLPSYSCGKLFTDQLFLKEEPLEDYPKSVQGKLFNVIMDLFLTALSSENDDEPLCLQKLNICNEQLYKLKLNCDSEDDESDDECENEESDSEYLYDTTKLTKEVQLERIALCVQLLLDFLEVDLMEFLVKFKGNLGLSINVNSWKPLIAKLDNIPYTELFGAINTCTRKEYSYLISKYINLLAEVARIKDLIRKESLEVYPYFGKNCLELTNTLTDTISKSEISLKNKIENLAMLPSWVQMYTYGNWISKRIGISFESSIGYVVKVLKLCVKELTTENNTEEMITTSDNSEALKILKKHNISLKNINQRNETGKATLKL